MQKFKDLFYMRKSDRKVVLFFLVVGTAALLTVMFLGSDNGEVTPVSSQDSLTPKKNIDYFNDFSDENVENGRPVELFPFDPNTADSVELRLLGLKQWQIRSLYHYRQKGGVFHRPQDFARLYGLTAGQYRMLEPYIKIGDDFRPASELAEIRQYEEERQLETFRRQDSYKPYKEYDRDTLKYPVKLKPGERIDLASADTTMLKKVPGIGSGWAKAIVYYGKRLGGYVHVGQLKEIDGFPEESLPYFQISSTHIDKLKINELSVEKMRRHPYINFYQARAINDFRRLKGKIKNLDQLRLLKDFPPEAIERLRPYVEY